MLSIQVLLILLLGFCPSVNALFDREVWESGDVFINNNQDSLFYYLFRARNATNRGQKLIIWLSGGPGCSSMNGLITENGPYLFDKYYKIVHNHYSWNTDYDLVFVDQPVGTGYALVKDDSHYCKDQSCVAKNFYEFLFNFVTIYYPEYAGKPIYITGESYAGHYIPSISEYILRANNPYVNLTAVAIGNGLTDMATQTKAHPLYVRENTKIGPVESFMADMIAVLCYVNNFYRSLLSDAVCILGSAHIGRLAGIINVYHIKHNKTEDELMEYQGKFMNDATIQQALGIKEKRIVNGLCDPKVNQAMIDDICTPYTNSIAYILDKGKPVLLYYGDLDYICNWRGGEVLADSIEWSEQNQYKNQIYQSFKCENKTSDCGQYKRQGKLTFMRIYEAGHMVPTDQPEPALHLLRSFIKDDYN